MKLSYFSSAISFSCIFYLSSEDIFLSPVSRTWYPLIPDISINFTNHIRHFSFSTANGVIRIVFWSIHVLSVVFISFLPKVMFLLYYLEVCCKAPITSVFLSLLYTLKGFHSVFFTSVMFLY